MVWVEYFGFKEELELGKAWSRVPVQFCGSGSTAQMHPEDAARLIKENPRSFRYADSERVGDTKISNEDQESVGPVQVGYSREDLERIAGNSGKAGLEEICKRLYGVNLDRRASVSTMIDKFLEAQTAAIGGMNGDN